MHTNTTSNSAFAILALLSMLAIGGCSQKSSSEEIGHHAAAQKSAAKTMHVAKAKTAEAEAAPPAAKQACGNCGVVISVKEVELEGKGSGLGVIAGGVTGGLVGNQVGQGTGRDLATVAGIVGGAIAGNKIEEKIKKTRVYDVAVRLENGEERVVRQKTLPGVAAGDKVKVEGEQVVRQ